MNQRPILLTISCPRSTEPLGQMADEIEKEVALWDADDLVADHNEQGETLCTGEAQPVGNGVAEIF